MVAGQYTCKDGRNSPCLVYVSFNHKIYVYWKVELERMESTNLLRLLEEKEQFSGLLKELRVGELGTGRGGEARRPSTDVIICWMESNNKKIIKQ